MSHDEVMGDYSFHQAVFFFKTNFWMMMPTVLSGSRAYLLRFTFQQVDTVVLKDGNSPGVSLATG